MPDSTPDTPPAPVVEPPTGPTPEEMNAALQAQLAEAARQNQYLANETQRLAQERDRAWTAREEPKTDPLATALQQAIVDPNAAASQLRAQLAAEARANEQRTQEALARQLAANQAQMQTQATYNAFVASNPEYADPAKQPALMGEMVRIAEEYRQKSTPIAGDALMRKAADALRSRNRPGAPAPAFVEGAAAPNLSGSAPEPPAPARNPLEEYYGLPAGTILPRPTAQQMEQLTREHVDAENAERQKHQIYHPVINRVQVAN